MEAAYRNRGASAWIASSRMPPGVSRVRTRPSSSLRCHRVPSWSPTGTSPLSGSDRRDPRIRDRDERSVPGRVAFLTDGEQQIATPGVAAEVRPRRSSSRRQHSSSSGARSIAASRDRRRCSPSAPCPPNRVDRIGAPDGGWSLSWRSRFNSEQWQWSGLNRIASLSLPDRRSSRCPRRRASECVRP